MKIDIKIKDQKALQTLNLLARRSEDLSPAMQAIAGVLVDDIEEAFQSEQSPNGEIWASLSDTTIKRREKSGYWPGQKLQQTGRLASSLTSSFGKDYAVAGTNVIYAATHQFGAKKGSFGSDRHGRPIPWGDIPARPFLGLSNDGRHEIEEIIARFIGAPLA